MDRRLTVLFSVLIAVLLLAGTVYGQENFYNGKTIRIIVGFSPGGGFDIYTRMIARHMRKHIPGVRFVVQNMTGAGSLIAANYLFNQAQPDGLTMGKWSGALVSRQLFGGKGINFDARKFEWVGVPVTNSLVCVLTKKSGINSVHDWFKMRDPVVLGGLAPGNTPSDVPRILAAALRLPLQLVEGYKGTADIRLATERGETAGGCLPWEALKTGWKSELADGSITPVLQIVRKPLRDLPTVPNAIDLAKDDEARDLIRFGASDINLIVRSYTLPPRTPKDRLNILRRAFRATMEDPDFLAEIEKAQFDIDPLHGEEVERIVGDLFSLDSVLIAKLRKILFPGES